MHMCNHWLCNIAVTSLDINEPTMRKKEREKFGISGIWTQDLWHSKLACWAICPHWFQFAHCWNKSHIILPLSVCC